MRASIYVGIIICGICLGILTGISISPVIQATMTGLITIIVAILSVTTGIQENERATASPLIISKLKSVNVLPITFFILFFTLGSFAGIRIRTTNLFGSSPKQEFNKLKEMGFSNEEIKKILKRKYLKENETQLNQAISATVLFSDEIKDKLDLIKLKTGKELEAELKALNMPAVDSFLNVTHDSISIEALKVFLCTKE